MAIGDATSGTSTSGQVYFAGLGSGTDFDTLIKKLVEVEQSRVKTYQTWQKSWLTKNTAFKDLNSKMLSLRTTLQGMDTVNEFLKKSADSTDSSSLTATAGGEAESGTYTYTVKQLAQNKMMVTGTGYNTNTEDINSQATAVSFNYTYKGVTISNSVPASATINDLAAIINANPSNNGVRASVLYDGTKYYMQLRGLDTGAASSLVVASSSSLPGFSNGSFNITQANQDAQIKINNWPLSNAWISRASNTISDVVTGLTLTLKNSGAGTLTVGTDADAVLENVRTFVNQVNTVRKQVRDLTKFDSNTKEGSILTGNYGLQIIGTIMQNITAAPGIGFNDATDRYTSLSPLGLSTDSVEGSATFGQIILDEDKFKEALEADPLAVGKIFAAQYSGDTDSAQITYSSYIQGITKAGEYNVQYTVAGGKITSATINGHAASFASNSANITGASGQDEAGMVVRVNDLTDGTYSHNVYLRLGKAPELVDELADLTNADTGPLNILQKNYVTISDNIQKKIDSENRRISAMETHMRNRFARLDALLGQYSQIQGQLSSQIAQISKA
ncbi:Flagellar hook-associated protein 2 [Fundidesulfovibrio magnetotacticus]|uniref:Flagellar hook-associated protein 2 n=1 Tax=Fundidesulfovibrio magnetotacticus TaxID=2730080 RepID=A0A6V8M1I5_9BACT|nr:flagellar filament capping protein FliD [Fundidesulfovibrio magnetotacticus]GFK95707.1 Flagellar hook-associated protein 2 [Fundidesulfovibrio magnetotacticus]